MYGHSILSKILLLSADIAKKAMICKKQFQFFPLNRNPQKPNSGCLGCQVHPSTRISRGQTYLPLQTKLSSSADISCTLILCCIFLRHLSFHNTHTKLSYLLTPPVISQYTYQALISSYATYHFTIHIPSSHIFLRHLSFHITHTKLSLHHRYCLSNKQKIQQKLKHST